MTRRYRSAARLTLALLLVLGVAHGQSSADQQQGAPSEQGGATSTAGGGGAGPDVSNVTPAEMKKKATATVAKIDSVEEQISAMVLKAKDDRDVVKVLCLSDKSNQVALALGTAKDRQSSMLAALARDALSRATHEYRLLVVVGDRVDLLFAEANQCFGGEVEGLGDSVLLVTVDPNLPAGDPANIPLGPVIIVVPIPASGSD